MCECNPTTGTVCGYHATRLVAERDEARTEVIERYGHFYVNCDDGYPWLTCERCNSPLHVVEAGLSLPDLLLAATMHRCATGGDSDGTS